MITDISRSISPKAVVYPGDDALGSEAVCTIGPDAPCNITKLVGWTTHFLTHVDAPLHFIPGGKTLDDVDLERLIGPAVVVDVSGDEVSVDDVPDEAEIAGKALLFKTRNSLVGDEEPFEEGHVYVSAAAAERAVNGGALVVGIDYLSVDRFGDEDYPVHKMLLGNDVLILEGLNLRDVPAGSYQLVALPLKVTGADGAPVRAILTDETGPVQR